MALVVLDRMWERIQTSRSDSDTSFFLELMNMGELVTKLSVLAIVAAIVDDREKNRHRLLHQLVRVDGIGDWSAVMDNALLGPSAQHLQPEARVEQRELTQRMPPPAWQYEAAGLLWRCLKVFEPEAEELSTRIDGRKWLSLFATLRNRSRGHGVIRSSACNRVCPWLDQSLKLVTGHFSLFGRSWAYLHQNLSGKYRVTPLTDDVSPFADLKSKPSTYMPDGVYVYFDQPTFVELLRADVDASDFFFPNGDFSDRTFALISYISGNVGRESSIPYLAPATELPESATQGLGRLEVQGPSGFGNIPPMQLGYVKRLHLERELQGVLLDDRRPVVTLVGRGGIGKTSLALAVLHQVMQESGRYLAVLWLSARDIELLPEGPKPVRRHVFSEEEVAQEVVNLLDPREAREKGFNARAFLAGILKRYDSGPLLLVFDNFETVRSPGEFFSWIDTHIRNPNKVLITTRFREFKGDYPVEVGGMTEAEAFQLIELVSSQLGIRELLTPDYGQQIYQESRGHPYVIKVLLGELSKERRRLEIRRVVAGKEDMLEALFERTYARLSLVAKRVFLTLCNWRSMIPQVAIEAVLMRPENELMDVGEGIEELQQASMVEVNVSENDQTVFLSVPLAAFEFGERKLLVSPMRTAIGADKVLLQDFGAVQQSDLKRGIGPRIEKLFKCIAIKVGRSRDRLNAYRTTIEFIARKHSLAWRLLSKLFEEIGDPESLGDAKEALKRYLERAGEEAEKVNAWKELARLCRQTGDVQGEIHALVELAELPKAEFWSVSSAANRLNAFFSIGSLRLDDLEKQIIVKRLATVMENRTQEANATDCSRLAWLYMQLRDLDAAARVCRLGLQMDPNESHCKKLLDRLSCGK